MIFRVPCKSPTTSKVSIWNRIYTGRQIVRQVDLNVSPICKFLKILCKYKRIPGLQITPASSPWSQSCTPQPLYWHFSILISFPVVQLTSSIQICATDGAPPNRLPCDPPAPALYRNKTNHMMSSDSNLRRSQKKQDTC